MAEPIPVDECDDESNSRGGAVLREAIFTLYEKKFGPDFSADDFTQLYLSIEELYSTPALEEYWITNSNMNEEEQAIGARIRNGSPWYPDRITERYARTERIPTSRRVLDGMRLSRVNILPELVKDCEPGACFVRRLIKGFIGVEGIYCKKWSIFHAENHSNIANALIHAKDAILADASLSRRDKIRKITAVTERFRPNVEAVNGNREFWWKIRDEIRELYETDYQLTD